LTAQRICYQIDLFVQGDSSKIYFITSFCVEIPPPAGEQAFPFAPALFIRDDRGVGWYCAAYLFSGLNRIRIYAAKQTAFIQPKSNPASARRHVRSHTGINQFLTHMLMIEGPLRPASLLILKNEYLAGISLLWLKKIGTDTLFPVHCRTVDQSLF